MPCWIHLVASKVIRWSQFHLTNGLGSMVCYGSLSQTINSSVYLIHPPTLHAYNQRGLSLPNLSTVTMVKFLLFLLLLCHIYLLYGLMIQLNHVFSNCTCEVDIPFYQRLFYQDVSIWNTHIYCNIYCLQFIIVAFAGRSKIPLVLFEWLWHHLVNSFWCQ